MCNHVADGYTSADMDPKQRKALATIAEWYAFPFIIAPLAVIVGAGMVGCAYRVALWCWAAF